MLNYYDKRCFIIVKPGFEDLLTQQFFGIAIILRLNRSSEIFFCVQSSQGILPDPQHLAKVLYLAALVYRMVIVCVVLPAFNGFNLDFIVL